MHLTWLQLAHYVVNYLELFMYSKNISAADICMHLYYFRNIILEMTINAGVTETESLLDCY